MLGCPVSSIKLSKVLLNINHGETKEDEGVNIRQRVRQRLHEGGLPDIPIFRPICIVEDIEAESDREQVKNEHYKGKHVYEWLPNVKHVLQLRVRADNISWYQGVDLRADTHQEAVGVGNFLQEPHQYIIRRNNIPKSESDRVYDCVYANIAQLSDNQYASRVTRNS